MSGSSHPKVLIVDDQVRNLEALEAMLSSLDCTLIRAQSADEALLLLLRHDFAAMVLDIQMPGMSGIELAKLIKERKRSRHIPILFLTAHMVNDEDVLRGYGVGAVDYLSKPINAEILRSKIGVFIDAFRKTLALAELNEALQGEIQEREKAQEALLRANEDLERRVVERTAALTQAHRRALEDEDRLRFAMQIAQIAAWEWQLDTGHVRWSTDPERVFGFPPGAFGPELRISRAVHPADKPRIDEAMRNASLTGNYEADYRAIRPDGTIVWITERGRVVEDGERRRMVGVSRDVTAEREAVHERERLLRSEQQARDEAERQSRLKDDFLAILSHELRTPMNAILGWLAILESGKAVRDVPAALAVIRRNAELQAQLIEDLLDMNRLMAGNIEIERTPVDVGSLLQATIQGLQPAADAKGVQLIASVQSGAGHILADARRLQQVLWNLVHNAVKFTPSGGRVETRIERRKDYVQITVRDNGQGISPAFLPHVFERFRQQDSSATRSSSGLGLGLSITKHLVELHGGSISVVSPGEGLGATFIVRIPASGDTRTTAASAENSKSLDAIAVRAR